MKILVVDDQRSARRVLRQILAEQPANEILEASSVAEALATVERTPPDLMLLDVRLSDDPRDRSGLALLRQLRAAGNATPAVMITSLVELAEVRDAMRAGAQDYVFKEELAPEMLLPVIDGFRERLALRDEVTRLKGRVSRDWGLAAMVGDSPAMERVRQLVRRTADAAVPVLIRGDTGVGKELVARALHEESTRRDQPFIAVNCSAVPSSLFESLLFGYERGVFTGAERRTRGQLEQAGAGTILLDEIAEMPLDLQPKLLRVLEERRFRPLGAEQDRPMTARVIAATHVDLEERVAEGRFRDDLFYRLNVVAIDVPTLADRRDDIPELIVRFVSELTPPLRFTPEAVTWLTRRAWPGNVRELRNLVDRVHLLRDSEVVDVAQLESLVGSSRASAGALEIDRLARSILALPDRLGSKLDIIERAILHHAIEACGGNKSAAARLIGVDRKALERRWDRLSTSAELAPPPDSTKGRSEG